LGARVWAAQAKLEECRARLASVSHELSETIQNELFWTNEVGTRRNAVIAAENARTIAVEFLNFAEGELSRASDVKSECENERNFAEAESVEATNERKRAQEVYDRVSRIGAYVVSNASRVANRHANNVDEDVADLRLFGIRIDEYLDVR